ncbi:NUDIX hydrolase [Paenibacillus cremeus]|nr:NUDIX hydrolase [Paenibacillus cremeus]
MNERWYRHLGVYGICTADEKLLVIHKGKGPYKGRYDLPGGTVEANELLTEAMKREFLEETGLHISIKKNIGVCEFVVPYALPEEESTHLHHVAVMFSVQSLSGLLAEHPEQFEGQDSLGACWVPIHELHAANSSPLVMEAKKWLLTEQLSMESQRLDDWVILGSTNP